MNDCGSSGNILAGLRDILMQADVGLVSLDVSCARGRQREYTSWPSAVDLWRPATVRRDGRGPWLPPAPWCASGRVHVGCAYRRSVVSGAARDVLAPKLRAVASGLEAHRRVAAVARQCYNHAGGSCKQVTMVCGGG